MKVFLDTNVIVAACLADHEHHARALPIMEQVHEGKLKGFVSGHTLLEAHSIFTRLPRSPRLTPMQAAAMILENVIKRFTVITLSGREYSDLAEKLGREGIVGGKSYDALHLACAEKSGADQILTFNVSDFSELGAHLRAKIAAP
jgi:predicted nucleic acid-binding protein